MCGKTPVSEQLYDGSDQEGFEAFIYVHWHEGLLFFLLRRYGFVFRNLAILPG